LNQCLENSVSSIPVDERIGPLDQHRSKDEPDASPRTIARCSEASIGRVVRPHGSSVSLRIGLSPQFPLEGSDANFHAAHTLQAQGQQGEKGRTHPAAYHAASLGIRRSARGYPRLDMSKLIADRRPGWSHAFASPWPCRAAFRRLANEAAGPGDWPRPVVELVAIAASLSQVVLAGVPPTCHKQWSTAVSHGQQRSMPLIAELR
jgi:hypothetical protein